MVTVNTCGGVSFSTLLLHDFRDKVHCEWEQQSIYIIVTVWESPSLSPICFIKWVLLVLLDHTLDDRITGGWTEGWLNCTTQEHQFFRIVTHCNELRNSKCIKYINFMAAFYMTLPTKQEGCKPQWLQNTGRKCYVLPHWVNVSCVHILHGSKCILKVRHTLENNEVPMQIKF